MLAKQKAALVGAGMLFLLPTCVPEPAAVSQICSGYDDQNVYCSDTGFPQAVHTEAKRLWLNQPLFLYVRFKRDGTQKIDRVAIETFFRKIRLVTDYAGTLSDLQFQERSLKRIAKAKDELKAQIDAQLAALSNARTDALAALEGGLKSLIAGDAAPIVAQLDADRKFYPGVTTALQNADVGLRALLPEFRAVIQDFKAFKASEVALQNRLASLANRASAVTVDEISAIVSELLALERSEYTAYSQFYAKVVGINARLGALQVAYANQLATPALGAGVAERGLREADLVSTGARTLGNMAAYAQARDVEMSKVVADLIRGCDRRREALVLAQANEATRQAFADAAHLVESTKFLDEANKRIAALLGAQPKSPTHKLPFYSAQYDDFTSFLQLEPMCQQVSSSNSSWMRTGCNAYAVNFDRARLFLNSLPSYIKLYSVTLRDNGAPENLLSSIQSDLSAGNLRRAVSTYDAAVRLVDGG
jgi:hypothetical protein